MILRRVAIALVLLQMLSVSPTFAASPTAKPKPKTSIVKSTPVFGSEANGAKGKGAIKKAATAKKKAVLAKKKIATARKKVATAKKKIVRRHVYFPPVRKPVPPSPSPAWPPHGFTSVGSAYARIPTGNELVGILSTMKDASSPVNSCSLDPKKPNAPAFSCAAILVGATEKCTWWKVSSTITEIDPSSAAARLTIGALTVLQPGAAGKTIQTIVLLSPIPLQTGVMFSGIHATCGIGPTTDTVPSSSFVADPSYTPPASPTPTPSPINS